MQPTIYTFLIRLHRNKLNILYIVHNTPSREGVLQDRWTPSFVDPLYRGPPPVIILVNPWSLGSTRDPLCSVLSNIMLF